jgi:hypothetical protein
MIKPSKKFNIKHLLYNLIFLDYILLNITFIFYDYLTTEVI